MNKQYIVTYFYPGEKNSRSQKRIIVERAQEPYWKQRGWKKSGNEFIGYFRTKHGSFKGKAEVSPSVKTKLYIKKTPKELENHKHWGCFVKKKDGWWFIHNHLGGCFDLSSGIIQIEQLLTEAFKL